MDDAAKVGNKKVGVRFFVPDDNEGKGSCFVPSSPFDGWGFNLGRNDIPAVTSNRGSGGRFHAPHLPPFPHKQVCHFESRICGMRNLRIRLKPLSFVFFRSLVMGFGFIAMALYLNQGCQSFRVPYLRDEESGVGAGLQLKRFLRSPYLSTFYCLQIC